MSVHIARLVFLDASNLNLLETPLRQIDIAGAEVATEISMPQAEGGRKRSELRIIPRSGITDDLNHPMILGIADSRVTIAGYFPVRLSYWGCDLVRVKVAAGLSVNKTDGVAIAREAEFLVRLVFHFSAVGVEEPVIVSILVVIASDLLLSRAFGIGLMMRVKQASSVAHVLESCTRAVGNFKGTVFADFRPAKVGLE
jgi:hypothetical protein